MANGATYGRPIGRDAELSLLASSVSGAADGALRAVAVRGDPGMGKTLCEDTDIDSVCRAITPNGIVLSWDLWFDPDKVLPFPGPPTPGGPDTGSPGGGGGESTWIPAQYIPKDPCDIFRPVRYEYYAGVKVQGGPLQTPITIDGLVMSPKKPKCVPGVGLIFE